MLGIWDHVLGTLVDTAPECTGTKELKGKARLVQEEHNRWVSNARWSSGLPSLRRRKPR